MAAARFQIVHKADGSVKKLSANIGEKKELNVTVLNNKAYLHISDMKHAFKDNGKFNKAYVKQVSLSMDELAMMKSYILDIEAQVQDFIEQIKVEQQQQQQQQQLMDQDHLLQNQVADVYHQVPQQQQAQQQQQQLYQQQVPQKQLWQQVPQQQQLPIHTTTSGAAWGASANVPGRQWGPWENHQDHIWNQELEQYYA